jgi:iron-sulfur cluster assembly 2
MSLALVKGATVDFATELIGSNFRISDNPQAKNSGCGCGVSWEAKI